MRDLFFPPPVRLQFPLGFDCVLVVVFSHASSEWVHATAQMIEQLNRPSNYLTPFAKPEDSTLVSRANAVTFH